MSHTIPASYQLFFMGSDLKLRKLSDAIYTYDDALECLLSLAGRRYSYCGLTHTNQQFVQRIIPIVFPGVYSYAQCGFYFGKVKK